MDIKFLELRGKENQKGKKKGKGGVEDIGRLLKGMRTFAKVALK